MLATEVGNPNKLGVNHVGPEVSGIHTVLVYQYDDFGVVLRIQATLYSPAVCSELIA